MANLKGSETEKCLLKAFAGESQARNRYTYFASVAKKEGFEQISFVFLDTADNEKEHAKRLFSFLQGGDVEITAAYPAGCVGDTKANLKAAADGEKYEWSSMYPEFADVAKKEGFGEIANLFTGLAGVEVHHEKVYRMLLANVEKGSVFKKDKPTVWRCRNCGHLHTGKDAPAKCPVCTHPMAHFEVLAENY